MILILVKYRRYVALFLYGIFYMQFVMASVSEKGYHTGLPNSDRYNETRFVRDRRLITAGDQLRMKGGKSVLPSPDSVVLPLSRSGNGLNVPASPSFRIDSRYRNPLAERTITPGAVPAITSAKLLSEGETNAARSFIGGPNQPEMQTFQSVNGNNMVDLFSGDFSYNIPLLDVGGYPVNIAYHSGRSMDEDASWVGLGWNINPGSITRDMRGIPDDFNGGADTIKKVSHIKDNVNWGVTAGANYELAGLPLDLGPSVGLFHTTYNGWGMELALNPSLSAGDKSTGIFTAGMKLQNNSQTGLTLNPSLSYQYSKSFANNNGTANFGVQLTAPYNTRTGLKDIHLGLTSSTVMKSKSGRAVRSTEIEPVGINFAWPSYTPDITMPLSNYNYTFTAKLGGEMTAQHPNFYLEGYYGKEYIAPEDTAISLPAYGYLNFQNRNGNWSALTDFNREKEMTYREKPAVPHIGIPSYTYDVFTVSGEGTGGQFRAYRGDIGFISDHLISTRTKSDKASIDLGGGNMLHDGIDLNVNYSNTTTGPWLNENTLRNSISFRNSNGLFEAAYFRNPGEKAINSKAFYNAIGNDDVVAANLYQPGNSGPSILATNFLTRYRGKQAVGTDTLSTSTAVRSSRDKRSQAISYLTASEAAQVGLDKYINHYAVNQFGPQYCQDMTPPEPSGSGTGLTGYYFDNEELRGPPATVRNDTLVFFNWSDGSPFWYAADGVRNLTNESFPRNHFSVRWLGRLKAPVSGTYAFGIRMDDGARFWMNDTLLINDWHMHNAWDTCRVNLVAGKFYNVRIEYFQYNKYAVCQWGWRRPDQPGHRFDTDHKDTVDKQFLYPMPALDTMPVTPIMTRENRVNNFRKANHLSEIDVLNPDGRKYVYGVPVYNLLQKEVSFAVNKGEGNIQTGLTSYTQKDNSTGNSNGKDGFYSRQEVPAYAHSFLLSGILSPDYVDLTGDGISDDDIGDAVKFTYSKTSGIANPYGWRAPYVADSATYNEGFRSYDRDDRAHYIYGQKELWYLHTIESKTMIATFTLQPRADLMEVDEGGHRMNTGKGMCLKQIDLYSKADFLQHNTNAVPIKTVHFEYSYELCRGINQPVSDSGKLTLKRIWFTYNNNNKKKITNPYLFNYHSNNPRYKVNSADKWGTYKDASQNPAYSSAIPLTNAEYPYSLQDSTLAAFNAGAWALDSIQLPSGGRIKVNYESDDYAYVQNRRSTLMCRIAGLGTDASGAYSNRLYNLVGGDGLYVYVNVPYAVSGNQDIYSRYLEGITKLFFRLYIKMPTDDFGSGSEYVPCYAEPDLGAANWYGRVNDHLIWIKVKGVNKTGDGDGSLSPLAQTAINYLRLNLPSKAYPGSELNDNLNLVDGIKILFSLVANITGRISGFSNMARGNSWANIIDTSARSFIRLDCPNFKKLGGGSRVKSVLIYDNWNAMTGKKETVYGQIYDYTTTRSVNGVSTKMSSGVAAWEPGVGSEENPFHLPIEYVDRVSVLAPASLQYTEEPLGESFFPGPSVGYSKVRVRSIHTTGTRSANGYAESTFFTSYDFPTSWDWSMLDNNTKKRYKPILSNFLRINVKNSLALSQGFKVELNDMNGKPRTEATYSETDTVHPISFTENFYKVDNGTVQSMHLNNFVTAIDPHGNVDTAAIIGKDAELMTDMRDQTSTVVGANINLNGDMFLAGAWPVIIPSLLNLYQQESNTFRSVAMMKVIQRYGILDSVVHIDKGSKVSSKNLLYDAETGSPLLVRTQNEFNDSLFQFNYPAHWAYPAVGPAYQNIASVLAHLLVSGGKIIRGLSAPDSTYLAPGDELLVYSRQTIAVTGCNADNNLNASFPDAFKLWVIDTNAVHGGPKNLFLVDQYGIPFSGYDVSLKVIRSGFRNVDNTVGSVTSLGNPLVKDGSGIYHLVFDSTTRVITSAANELKQFWKVSDVHRSDVRTSCIYTPQDSAIAAAEGCSCLKPFFDYLISSHQLFNSWIFPKTVGALVTEANNHGAGIVLNSCPILSNNANLPFFALTLNPNGPLYMAVLGNEIMDIRSLSGLPVPLYNLVSNGCDQRGRVIYRNPGAVVPPPDTVTVNIVPAYSVNLISNGPVCPPFSDSLMVVDSTSDHLMVENNLPVNGFNRNAVSILRFDHLNWQLPANSTILSARMILQADQRGHIPGTYNNANSVHSMDTVGYSLSAPAGWFPFQPLDTMIYQAYYTPWFGGIRNAIPFQNDTLDVLSYLKGYQSGLYPSSTFVLTQGSGSMHSNCYDSGMIARHIMPRYLTNGFTKYYSTFYSQRYSDPSKWPVMQVTYVRPQPQIDTMGAILEFNSTVSCTTVNGRTCYSAITDTMVNPYQYALLGDYRPRRSYVYYGRRKESDLSPLASIRTAGVINNFAPFWKLQSGQWGPSYDTTRWVWNSETTLFNRKGFELENKDPLGRYNAGLYGYGLTLPTAVVQNSRNQEAAFEGFEDYGFSVNACGATCTETRPFDFSAYQSQFSDSAAHTGLRSLRIPQGGSVSLISLPVAAMPDPGDPSLVGALSPDNCLGSVLSGMKAGASSVLPPFKPFAGRKMLLSAWVKEKDSCTCLVYHNNHILVNFALNGPGNTAVWLSPSGNLIEGWQRYEGVVAIPANAVSLTLTLQASDSATTYFDDIRLLPFNGEMKSYVYNPVTLRLMAELDENNYATFYEYDDDGTLVRVKKETQRGIQTIKETRSALLKDQ